MTVSNVVPILSCARCGALGKPMEVRMNGEKVNAFIGCGECTAAVSAELVRIRPIFEAMIAAGLSRDLANDTMTYILREWTP